MRLSTLRVLIPTIIIGVVGSTAYAGDWCKDYRNKNGEKRGASEVREFTLPATGNLEIDGGKNGGIKIQGADRGDVFVRACVRAWSESQAEADNLLQTTRIETSGVMRAVNDLKDEHISVSFMVSVPRNTNLTLQARNGGLKVDGVNGNMNLSTVNGGIKLSAVSGAVKGRTTNGGVSVGLGGYGWTGEGLDVETVNGGVKIYLPASFAANIEAGTVNGGFKSDFPELQLPKKEGKTNSWSRNKRVSAAINGGGARIRAITTNGGVKIMSAAKAQ